MVKSRIDPWVVHPAGSSRLGSRSVGRAESGVGVVGAWPASPLQATVFQLRVCVSLALQPGPPWRCVWPHSTLTECWPSPLSPGLSAAPRRPWHCLGKGTRAGSVSHLVPCPHVQPRVQIVSWARSKSLPGTKMPACTNRSIAKC